MSENIIDQQIKEQGEVVRQLKSAKAPKEKVCVWIERIFIQEIFDKKIWMKSAFWSLLEPVLRLEMLTGLFFS